MSSTNPIAASLLEDILNLKQSYLSNEPGARESLIDLSQALITSLEIPSEAIQRVGAAEVRFLTLFLAVSIHFSRTVLTDEARSCRLPSNLC